MNKKLLICGAIAAALLITACVKKEEPKQEEQEQVETAPSEAMPAEPAQFEPLDATDTQEIEPTPSRTEIIRKASIISLCFCAVIFASLYCSSF